MIRAASDGGDNGDGGGGGGGSRVPAPPGEFDIAGGAAAVAYLRTGAGPGATRAPFGRTRRDVQPYAAYRVAGESMARAPPLHGLRLRSVVSRWTGPDFRRRPSYSRGHVTPRHATPARRSYIITREPFAERANAETSFSIVVSIIRKSPLV